MIKAKIQLFDDSSGKDIGEQKIVLPEACTFYYLPNTEATVEFKFDFSTEDPASLFEGFSFEEMKGSIIKEY